MDAPGLLTRITKRSSAFLKLKPTQPCWPDAEDSTGSFYDTVDGEKYWNLKNQNCSAFLEFSQLSKKLASILKKHTEAPTVLARWKAYMIGESAPLCALGILFCCGDTEYLKTAASYISASGAVDETSGVIVKFRSTLPKYKGKLIPLGTGRQEVDFLPGGTGPRVDGSASQPMEPHVYHTPSAGNRSTEHSHISTLKALGYSPQCFTASEDVLPGEAVYVEMVDGIQTATIGGRIECGDQELFVTAAHPFTHQRFEAKEKAANGKERLPTRLKEAGCLYYSSCFNERPELDYALIQPRGEVSMIGSPSLQPSDSMFAFPVFTSKEDFRNLVETNVRTSSASAAVMLGELDTIPEFLEIPGATELQEVYAAHFESFLALGDSGSWVYNAEGDILHGHIVAGVPEDGLALIVPAHLVFADIMEHVASMPVQSSKKARLSQNQVKARPTYTPANLTNQSPPCNTLYVGNLPLDTSEDELKAAFSGQRGYKRLCFRTKRNGPMCFVEFEDTSLATEALEELNGHMLHDSVKSGIELSFSKNPLGVRKTKHIQEVVVDESELQKTETENTQGEVQNEDKAALAVVPVLNMDLGFASTISQAAQGAQVTPNMTGNDLWITSEAGHTPSDFSAFRSSVLLRSESLLQQSINKRGDIGPYAWYTTYLANLPVEATEDDLYEFFANYGPTVVRIVKGKDGRRKGFAKIKFYSLEGVAHLPGTELDFMGSKVQFSNTEPIETSPLLEFSVATSEHFSGTTQKALEARITQLGASIAPRVTFETDILIATEKDYAARTKEVAAALKYNVHIVSIDWLDKTEESDAKADVMEFSLVKRPKGPLRRQQIHIHSPSSLVYDPNTSSPASKSGYYG